NHKGEELTKATLSGTVNIEDEAVARTEHDDPFLEIPRAEVNVREADAMTRSLSVSSASIEGAKLRARRDARGVVDLVDIFGAASGTAPRRAAPRGPPPPPPRPPPPPPPSSKRPPPSHWVPSHPPPHPPRAHRPPPLW